MTGHRTKLADVVIGEWRSLGNGFEVARLLDASVILPNGRCLAARLTFGDAESFALAHLARLIHPDEIELLHLLSKSGKCLELVPYFGTPIAETALEHHIRHDMDMWRQIEAAQWDGLEANFGKHWTRLDIDTPPPHRAALMGAYVKELYPSFSKSRRGPGFVQPRPSHGALGAHGDQDQYDDLTTSLIVRRELSSTGIVGSSVSSFASAIIEGGKAIASQLFPNAKEPSIMRPTIRLGDSNIHVAEWQKVVGVVADGHFGAQTERETKRWQSQNKLVADGVVGSKSWAAAGYAPEIPQTVAVGGKYPGNAPACTKALKEATEKWGERNRASDGIAGDLAHQFKPGPDGKLGTKDDVPNNSDHNLGLAFDLTHDPEHGVDCMVLRDIAFDDPRTSYVIFNGQIKSKAREAEGWRKYSGANKHNHHMHDSIYEHARNDTSPWWDNA